MPDEAPHTLIAFACRTLSTDSGEYEAGEVSGPVELAYLVYDRSHNKIVSNCEKIIQPLLPERKDNARSCLSSESELTELGEHLADILQKLDEYLDNQTAVVVTCGPLTLRHFIQPQASQRKVRLHERLFSYVDVAVEFKRNFPEHSEDAQDIHQIAPHFGIDLDAEKPAEGLERCRIILEIMQQLPQDGSRQIIQQQYSQAQSSAPLLEDTIVRASGFTPNTTDFRLARFFAGLNIESGGIVMCMSPGGRPTGEALVRFTDPEQRDLALKRNGFKFGSRNIEISKASVQDFSRIVSQAQADYAQGLPNMLSSFLQLAAPSVVIIRMRGLPYNTKAAEIVSFFGDECPVYRGQHGIMFVYHPDRRPTGDAFVLFETQEHGKQALTKHRQTIGKRYVELFQTTRQEVLQVSTRYGLPSNGLRYPAMPALRGPLTPTPVSVVQCSNYLSNIKNIIRLRGLPYAATVQDILDFLGDFAQYVVTAGVHMVYNYQGRPSGDAFIEMRSAEYAQQASESLHKKHIGERYIEVFQCSSSDMSLMLTHGIPSFRHQHSTWANGPYSPRTPPHVSPQVPAAFTYPPVSSSTLTYPSVSSPAAASHSTNSPQMISVPSSPTLSPTARVLVTSPSHGYVTYSSPPYNVFNFTYPSPSVPVDRNLPHASPVMSPAPYDSTVFFPTHGYQVNSDYGTQMDPLYVPVNQYLSSVSGYYPSNEPHTDHGSIPAQMPAYVETYSG